MMYKMASRIKAHSVGRKPVAIMAALLVSLTMPVRARAEVVMTGLKGRTVPLERLASHMLVDLGIEAPRRILNSLVAASLTGTYRTD